MNLESLIARTRAVLDHALAIQASPTTEERIGDIVIRDNAEAGQVVITFPSDHTPHLRKRIRSPKQLDDGYAVRWSNRAVLGLMFA